MKRLRSGGPASPRSGLVLLWALFIAIVAGGSAFVMATLAASSKRIADMDRSTSEARALSRGASVFAEDALADALQGSLAVPASGTASLDGFAADWTLSQLTAPVQELDGSGLSSFVSTWRVEGTATVRGVPVTTRRVVRASTIPIFQYALFYEGDMHFFYPAPMFIQGPVHCNGDLYLWAHKGLTFDTNHVVVAGDVYGEPMFSDWLTAYPYGDTIAVDVRQWVASPFDPVEPVAYGQLESVSELDALGIWSTGGFDANFSGFDGNGDGDWDDWSDVPPFGPGVFDKFGPPAGYVASGAESTLQTQQHGVLPAATPALEDFTAFVADPAGDWEQIAGTWTQVAPGTGTHSQGPFLAQAGLVLVSHPDGSWEAFDETGADISASIASAVSIVDTYDARQAEGSSDTIQMAVVDMQQVASLGYYPSNGLFYCYGSGEGTGTDLAGFQLSNGADLAGDLTVVSPDAVYIQGDYNTVSNAATAVMADAVNLLSNDWDNSKSSGSLPNAAETTFNTSILTGDVIATAAEFNGGPHNLVRLHESWTGIDLNIEGSLVCLGPSERATGAFAVSGDYYKAPNRNWVFDIDLTDPTNLPPFTPTIVEVETLMVW